MPFKIDANVILTRLSELFQVFSPYRFDLFFHSFSCYNGSRHFFSSWTWWWSDGRPWPGAPEVPGCFGQDKNSPPAWSYTDLCCVLCGPPAPLDFCLFIWELILLLYAKYGFFHSGALLSQVCLWTHLHWQNTHNTFCCLSLCRSDCESPASFLCSYPLANVSMMRNRKHVCIKYVCTCSIYINIQCMDNSCNQNGCSGADIWASLSDLSADGDARFTSQSGTGNVHD